MLRGRGISFMVSWFLGLLVSWFRGFLVSSFWGFLVSNISVFTVLQGLVGGGAFLSRTAFFPTESFVLSETEDLLLGRGRFSGRGGKSFSSSS